MTSPPGATLFCAPFAMIKSALVLCSGGGKEQGVREEVGQEEVQARADGEGDDGDDDRFPMSFAFPPARARGLP